jgi:formylglycine-generating enzyme required for sulfatase activity
MARRGNRMADVFISYKREDKPLAMALAEALRAEGFSTWWDDRLTPAEHWDQAIENNIRDAAAVIVMWTPLSVASEWVRTEAEFAKRANKLVPLVRTPCQPPLAFLLVQGVDLTRWDGADRTDRNWRKMIAWLSDLISGQSVAAEATPEKAADWRIAYGEFRGEPVLDGKAITRSTQNGLLFRDHKDLPLMRVIGGGQFKMGSADWDSGAMISERPQRAVNVAGPLAVGIFPITFEEWDAAKAAGGVRTAAKDSGFGRGSVPVVNVNFPDAQEYVRWASAKAGERYRLLSEAEWEYACRAGSDGAYAFSGEITAKLANFGSKSAVEVGKYPANAFGLHDVHGNVREWVEDLWHDAYSGAPADAIAWTTGHSAMRVVRGGAWLDAPMMLRSAARGRADASERCNFIGFRVAREIV